MMASDAAIQSLAGEVSARSPSPPARCARTIISFVSKGAPAFLTMTKPRHFTASSTAAKTAHAG